MKFYYETDPEYIKYWADQKQRIMKNEKQEYSKLGAILFEMLTKARQEWVLVTDGYGNHAKDLLIYKKGNLRLNVTQKHCFDVAGSACLNLYDKKNLWPIVEELAKELNMSRIYHIDGFHHPYTTATRQRNQLKFFKTTMKGVMGIIDVPTV